MARKDVATNKVWIYSRERDQHSTAVCLTSHRACGHDIRFPPTLRILVPNGYSPFMPYYQQDEYE